MVYNYAFAFSYSFTDPKVISFVNYQLIKAQSGRSLYTVTIKS